MSDTIVILVNGEVFAGGYESTISDQKASAQVLAEGLFPILSSELKIAIMHGNKPQVGYVLFRSEVASHILHPIPLDVCGADTQGATGYMLSQSILNVLSRNKEQRQVMSVVTQTVVNSDSKYIMEMNKQIGPWLDHERAKQRRHVYGWQVLEEPGYGFRRVVSSPPPLEIVEIDGIKQLVEVWHDCHHCWRWWDSCFTQPARNFGRCRSSGGYRPCSMHACPSTGCKSFIDDRRR